MKAPTCSQKTFQARSSELLRGIGGLFSSLIKTTLSSLLQSHPTRVNPSSFLLSQRKVEFSEFVGYDAMHS